MNAIVVATFVAGALSGVYDLPAAVAVAKGDTIELRNSVIPVAGASTFNLLLS